MVITIQGTTLPEVWEKSLLELWKNGTEIPTQYDAEGDPNSRDATALLVINEPFAEPRIHKAFPGGPFELEQYRQEVLDGLKDHWIDPDDGKWQYTYSERMHKYSVPGLDSTVNQIDYIINALKDCPYTRRAQCVIWKPWEDAGIGDPACLQRIWCRVIDGKLCMNVSMRSNDAFKAAYMNMFAFTELQKKIADAVGVPVGTYTHMADSYHIYGSYFDEFEEFLDSITKRPNIEDRTYRTDSDIWQFNIEQAKLDVKAMMNYEKATGKKGVVPLDRDNWLD